jgi:3-oxocholest-4-en-26-oyl-CoA dehydrogenase beta subunit
VDFNLDEEQAAIAELAGTILADRCSPEALREHEAGGEPFPPGVWSELAKADLLGVALPESVGGGGYGVLEASLIAEQVGRNVAPVPFVDTIAAARALAASGIDEVAGLIDEAIAGNALLVPALEERGWWQPPTAAPATTAEADGDAWRLTGTKSVRWGEAAAAFVVSASDGDGAALFLVGSGVEGSTLVAQDSLWGVPEADLVLDGAPAVRIGGAEAAATLAREVIALTCATVAGVAEGAIRITAAYVSEREQFGAKIGTFQAVGQRLADAYIDTEAIRLTARQAAWRLDAGLPADEELSIAKFWSTDGGHRIVHAAQHLHGGVGLDVEFPIHRYFRWAKVLELHHGHGTDHLRALGALLAAPTAAG